jgi:AhpC/TSA family
VLATLAAGATVEVRSSIAGNAQACYAVTAVVDGKTIRGYVLGNGLNAVADFERQRAANATATLTPAAPVEPVPAAAVAAPPVVVEKVRYPPFANFSALDMKGRAVSVRGLKGKVNIICFWSPENKPSFPDLLAVVRLYGQFHKQGVDALGVNLSGDSPELRDTVGDIHLPFGNVPNGRDIAARYSVDFSNLPRTYVLNENFEVIASGLHGKGLEDLVKKLVAQQ